MVFSEEQRPGTPMYTVKVRWLWRGAELTRQAYLPVNESFGFNGELRQATGGQAFPQLVFDHWGLMQGSSLDKGGKVEQIILDMCVGAVAGLR